MMANEQQTICDVCGKKAKSVMRRRNICSRCYSREDKISCPRCQSKVQSVSAETGLCQRCTIAASRPTSKCTRCSQTRPIFNVEESLCQRCHVYFLRSKRPRGRCTRCKIWGCKIDKETGLCSRCMSPKAKPEGECTYCHQIRVIHDQDAKICYLCYKNLKNQHRKKYRPNRLRICSVCGKLRVSELSKRAICKHCRHIENNGYAQCRGCNTFKAIYNKTQQLCTLCYRDHNASYRDHNASYRDQSATNRLHRYLADFSTPYQYNNRLFALLVTILDEIAITEKVNNQFRAFGQFLQTHRITEPLTWEVIEELLQTMGPTRSKKTQLVRASLLALGHLMASKGLIESHETYCQKRRIELTINDAPQHIQHTLQLYASWLWERKSSWGNVISSIGALTSFWSWCASYSITSPHEVTASVINNYLLTLYWQWSCSNCNSIFTFTPEVRQAPRICPNCGDVGTIMKVDRYAQRSVRNHNDMLHVFFEWARSNHKVIANPVRSKIRLPVYSKRHYPFDDIRRLCNYISAPDSDPIEALTLYLIIFHAFSVWELRHAEVPILNKLDGGYEAPPITSAYYILLPKREPSCGNSTPGRPDLRVNFPEIATPWLNPLLERFEHKRQELSKNRSNKYLLLSTHTALHNIPTSGDLVRRIVQRASQRVLGAKYNPRFLRITVAMMFVDSTNGGILKWLGWSSQQGFKYMWMQREVIQPAK
jgi:hypothetical protein